MATKTAVPRGLAQLVERSKKHIDGKYCYGLPHYQLSAKLKLMLVPLGNMELFEENDIDAEEHAGWMPFAILKDESQFLAVSSAPPYPVGMWEHETGKIYPVWPSIDDFIARVIDKKDKTPFEIFEKQLDKVSKLVDEDAYADALGIVEPAIKALPATAQSSMEHDDDLARAYNLYGLALKGVERFAEAMAAFGRAADLGETYADLNMLDIMLNKLGDPRGVIARTQELRANRHFDEYGRAWLKRYLAEAYLEVGDVVQAEAELRALVADHEIGDPEKIREARKDIEAYANGTKPNADAARGFLAWLREKTYEPAPEEAARNRAWYTALPELMQKQLAKAIKRDAVETDADIARAMDTESLRLEAGARFDDVAPFLVLTRLERLGFYGDPATLEPLRALPKLRRVTLNNIVIKDLKLPSRADRELLAAAKACDKARIAAALAAGAAITARDEHGHSALSLVACKHDEALCCWLIETYKADPWAGSGSGGTQITSFFADPGNRALEAAAQRAGIPHPDTDPFVILEHMPHTRGATFDKPMEDLGDLELAEGVSLAAAWPATVRFAMEAPKKDDKLFDVHRCGYHGLIVSARLADLLRGSPGLELLPVTLIDHASKPRKETYFYLNPPAVDCLDIERGYPRWNHINPDSISELAGMIIDPAKVGAAQIFRCTKWEDPIVITRALANRIADLGNVRFATVPR